MEPKSFKDHVKSTKNNIRRYLDRCVAPHFAGLVDIIENAKRFAFLRLSLMTGVEWNPNRDFTTILRRLLPSEDVVFKFLRLFESYLGLVLALWEEHQESLANVGDQDEVLCGDSSFGR